MHRLREARIAERVQTGNQIYALLLEFGIVLPLGERGIKQVPVILMSPDADLPPTTRQILSAQFDHYLYLARLIAAFVKVVVASLHAATSIESGMARSGFNQTTFPNTQLRVAPDQRFG